MVTKTQLDIDASRSLCRNTCVETDSGITFLRHITSSNSSNPIDLQAVSTLLHLQCMYEDFGSR